MANPNPSPATRFQSGNRANPNGRPPGRSMTAVLRRALNAPAPDGRTTAEALAESLIRQALAGDVRAFKLILDRTEGRAPVSPPGDDGDEHRPRIVIPDADECD